MYEFLKKIPFFAELSQKDLERLCELVDEVHLEPGELLFQEGASGDRAYVIQEGEIEIVKGSAGREVFLALRKSGDVIGEMSLLEEAPRSATVRARTASTLISIGQEQFNKLLRMSPSASITMLHTVLSRWRSMQAILQQSERMAQLGAMTAGVTHELNNPAAAVQRGTEQLGRAAAQVQQSFLKLSESGLSREQRAALTELERKARELARMPIDLDVLTRSDREAEMEAWLEGRGVRNAWEHAPTLVSLGFEPDDLDALISHFSGPLFPVVVSWLVGSFSLYSLLEEIHQGAARISTIVKSLKSYTYLDQAPVQEVDVHEGLDSTLVILRNKLKEGVNVRREYAEDLPRIQGYGSELNQVWTNLIDNAIDALEGQGQIVIRTRLEEGWVVVEIEDNGPGIPEEIQPKIFDPLFTTKEPGAGTGLGLNLSYNIVVNRHRGAISVYSRPGKTCFQVRLPIGGEGEPAPLLAGIPRQSDEELRQILSSVHTIAVVGTTSQPDRPAHDVPAYLQAKGYRIIPVTPNYTEVLGQKSYAELTVIPERVDAVLIFRPGEEASRIVEQAIQIGAGVVWMQEGIVNETAATTAREAGLRVVMDTCMQKTHRRLFQ